MTTQEHLSGPESMLPATKGDVADVLRAVQAMQLRARIADDRLVACLREAAASADEMPPRQSSFRLGAAVHSVTMSQTGTTDNCVEGANPQ